MFGLDSAFFKIGTKVFDVILLMLLWTLVSILGFGITCGAATTATYYVIDKAIIHDRGYILKNFFKSFKENFIKATIISIVLGGMILLLLWNLYYLNSVENMSFVLIALQWSVLIEVTIVSIYAYPVLAKLDISLKDVFKNAFYMANKHILMSVICLLAIGLAAYLTIFVNYLLLVPATMLAMFIVSKIVVGRVLTKYIDKDKLETFQY